MQVAFTLEVNGGDVVDLKSGENLLAHLGLRGDPCVTIAVAENQSRAAQDDEDNQEDDQLFAIHFAAVRLRLMAARTTPVMATRTGMAPMLTTLVQNSRE